ncbi:TatD family hydrolase [Marinicella gelatinilytica]|uniref:TatD family hydrolase n=1 Tax=Marinicella gelatinilytica TaxID=2996017 RepID=UPI0022610334|nr:TatD family hydrolase [Marinicella gelatinilytica]MCX7545685.1 TatD family hydrolase [Marinicella gelatinilytica]
MIDIGANLTHDSFDEDRDTVIAEAIEAGVNTFIITGSDLECSQKAINLAHQYTNCCYATVGIHPHHAKDFNQVVMTELRELLNDDKVVAVGETGLDYFRDFSPRPQQIESFEAHIELAVETGLPMFLHQREAHKDFLPILKQHRDALSDVVVHCFTDNQQALYDYLDLDCYIGITGWVCDERRGQHLLPLIHDIPLNRFLIETDSPYLMPRNLKPKPKSRRNEPKYLPHIADFIAQELNLDSDNFITHTVTNSRRLFRLAA